MACAPSIASTRSGPRARATTTWPARSAWRSPTGLCAIGALDPADLSLLDPAPFVALGVAIPATAPRRRPLTRACLDWSERRPHLAGALGAAVLQTFLDRQWLTRRPTGRALTVTDAGRLALGDILALHVDAR